MPLGVVPFPFGICRICRDKATGLHYGVATCEGCKGFFKRSISKHETFKCYFGGSCDINHKTRSQCKACRFERCMETHEMRIKTKGFFKRSFTKHETFKCYFGGSCDINPKTRSQCKACRFKRCMETGMSIDGVRMGRIPKVEKDKVLEAFHDGGSHYSNHELVVQQTDGGNYIFDLNKTETISKTTDTSSTQMPTCSSTPVTTTSSENITKPCGSDIGRKTEVHPEVLIENSDENNGIIDGLKESTDQSLTSQVTKKDLVFDDIKNTPLTESVDTTLMSNTKNVNTFGYHFPVNKASLTTLIDNLPSVKCENPFNDKYHNTGFDKSNEHCINNSYFNQKILNDHSMKQNTNASFDNFTFPEKSSNSLKDKTIGYNTNNQNVYNTAKQANGLNLIGPMQNTFTGEYQFGKSKEKEIKIDDLSKGDRGNPRGSTNSSEPNPSLSILGSHKLTDEYEDECLKRKKSFSPTLIRVLLEQVLDSQESMHVITERLQQKQQQGNLCHLLAQNISQRLTELSAKKRRSSLEGGSCPKTMCRKTEYLENVNPVNDVCPPVLSVGHHHLFEHTASYNESNQHVGHINCIHRHQQTYHPHVYCQEVHSGSCGKLSNDVFAETTSMSRKYGDNKEERLKEAPVSTGTVSSTSLSVEEEIKQQQTRTSLDRINIAMKILNRLKAEHREKIRQFKLGKVYIRVMTDSEEDIKETYSKLIRGIPQINDRILGFCNSIPGIHDITKGDQDVLMKRAYYDIWMLSNSEYLQGDVSYIIMESGEIYSKMAMRKILNDNMVEKLFEFANQFNCLNLTDLEVAILCATRLTSTDGIELSDRTKVAALHSHLLDVLAEEVKQNHEIGHARKLIDIFSLLPLLETVNRIQREIISKFSV